MVAARGGRSASGKPEAGDRYPRSNARRRFLLASTTGMAAIAGAGCVGAQHGLAFQPAAFDASTDAVVIWVRAGETTKVRVDFSTSGPNALARGPAVELTRANDFTRSISLERLPAGAVVHYRIVDAESDRSLSNLCTCRTAPVEPRTFTFAFSADMEDSYRPFRLFGAIGKARPEFFLHLGDTTYADHPRRQFIPSSTHYRRKHAANRRDASLQEFLSRHTTFATWDDHETENNGHGGLPHMAEARAVFREFWPCRSVTQDGLYRSFSWAGIDFVMLDTRSYRRPQSWQDGADKTMLGPAQKEWFKTVLAQSQARFKFVVTSVPFHGGGGDTWASYRTEQQELVRFIQEQKIAGVVLLTGDYHLARDWTNKGTGLREFMAGPIASYNHYERTPGARDRYAKSGSFHHGDSYNFGLVRVDPAEGRGVIEWLDVDGKVLGRVEFNA